MPKVAVIIPARYASTRLPAKPLQAIAGKPLIQHVWERCARARGIDAVIVATDDMRIAEAAFAFGAEVAMTSPKHRSGTDRVAEVAKNLRGYSHIINVQGDEPLIDPALIARLARALITDKKIKMITAACAVATSDDQENPNIVKVVTNRHGEALYFSRAAIPFVRDAVPIPPAKARLPTLNSQLPTSYFRHQGIYGYTTKFLLRFVKWKPGILEQAESLEQLRALENGAKIRVLQTKHAAIGVDTPDDIRIVEKLLAS